MWLLLLLAVLLAVALLYWGRTWLAWVLPIALLYAGWWQGGVLSPVLFVITASLFAAVAVLTGVKPLRRRLITPHALQAMKPFLPRMSETERIAIEAGTVWYEAEFFTGAPDWMRLLRFQEKELSARERAFLDGPCEKVCAMASDWEIRRLGDLPPEVWDYVKREGFMGMIIPEEHGGLGFSAAAHSAVVTKLSAHSVTLAVSVMVPNSLGPAELLLHYGTKEQKDHYLPRLARGEEVPCFALTEPGAGSDAGSLQSKGVVCRGTWEGREVLGMRLDWDKRYITLSPVATVIGLAFRLYDPDGLLGGEQDFGITCALVPADLPGVEIGDRHDPGVPFMNGPTRGEGVFVPLDAIIGGREMAGKGWMMLMQSLAAGRGISLPSMAAGSGRIATRTTGAYATVRQQFGLSIGSFEGIQERLARIGGWTYALDAARRLTAASIDDGERPSVASAIIKCYMTEAMRVVTNDAMDVLGGAGVCQGPRNILSGAYISVPIGITVEGANILTRSMIIFGQGAIRCHPFVQDEMRAAEEDDIEGFDRAFFGHVGFVFHNAARAFLLGLTDGAIAAAPVAGPVAPLYRRLTRTSAAFALAADFAMGTLGGALKRKETITGRLADVVAHLYLAAATLKRFHEEGSKERDLPFVEWFVQHALHESHEALRGVVRNLPLRPAAWILRFLALPEDVFLPWRAGTAPPSDRLSRRVARAILDGGEARERLGRDMYLPPASEPGLGQLEAAHAKVVASLAVHGKIRAAVKEGRLEKRPKATLVERALEAGVITQAEEGSLREAEEARDAAVAVDAFPQQAYVELTA